MVQVARGDQSLDGLKIPPHSIQAEQSVLGGLMLDNRAWDTVADRVGEEDFYRKDHRLIFRAILDLAGRDEPFDVITLSEILQKSGTLEDVGGLAYLGALAKDTPSAANIGAYAAIVRERSVLRQLIHVGTEISNSAFQNEGRDTGELLEYAEQKVFEIAEQRQRGSSGFAPIKSLLAGAVDRIETLFQQEGSITGAATGFDDFDEMTSGLQGSDLIIVAGRPSMGKTSFAMNIAENVAIKGDKPVAVFSMEMPGEQLAMRMMASLGRIDQHRIRTGTLEDDEWPRMTSAINILAEAKLFIDDTPALTPTEVRARSRRLTRDQGPLGLIVLDYLQLMQSPGSAENRVAEISDISRSLKALAKELNTPVMALSQLNRNLEQRPNKRPVMSDLRECVTGDTPVILADGRRIPIRELAGQQPTVVTVSEQGKLVNAKSDKVWCVGSKTIFNVHLASGRKIRATAKHRLLGAEGWQALGELQVGDRLAVARYLAEPAAPDEWPDLRVALLGQLIGDGSYLKGQPMRYTTSSEENSLIVTEAAEEEFGAVVRRYRGRRDWHQLAISGNGNRWQALGVNKWLRELGIFNQRSHEKRIPEAAFRLANEQVALLLKHLWATDGTIYTRKVDQKGGHSIHFSTNSRRLAEDVAALLLRFGVVARIQTVQKGSYRPTHMVVVYGAEMQRRFLESIGAFGPRRRQAETLTSALADIVSNTNVDTVPKERFDRIRMLMNREGISHRRMAALRGTAYGGSAHFNFAPSRGMLADYAELLDDDVLRQQCVDDLFWDKIVRIDAGGEEEVYDLTVPGPASWLADGVVSHNSGAIEQDADMIAFIYRDEVYNEDSPDKGTAEIIIGKQRNGPIGTVRLTFLGQYTRFESFIAGPYSDEDYA